MEGNDSGSRRQARAPRQRRRHLDTCWGGDRRLILIDVENVVGGPCDTVAKARWARQVIDDAIGVRPDDQVVVATDACGFLCAGLGWPGAGHRFGYGKDGADRELLSVLEEDVARRFGHVVLVSGDHIFTDPVRRLTQAGIEVTVVSHDRSLHAGLRRYANRTLPLASSAASAKRPA